MVVTFKVNTSNVFNLGLLGSFREVEHFIHIFDNFNFWLVFVFKRLYRFHKLNKIYFKLRSVVRVSNSLDLVKISDPLVVEDGVTRHAIILGIR